MLLIHERWEDLLAACSSMLLSAMCLLQPAFEEGRLWGVESQRRSWDGMYRGHSGLSLAAAQTLPYISKSSAAKSVHSRVYQVSNCQSCGPSRWLQTLQGVSEFTCGKVRVIGVAFGCSALLYCLCLVLISKSDTAPQNWWWNWWYNM